MVAFVMEYVKQLADPGMQKRFVLISFLIYYLGYRILWEGVWLGAKNRWGKTNYFQVLHVSGSVDAPLLRASLQLNSWVRNNLQNFIDLVIL